MKLGIVAAACTDKLFKKKKEKEKKEGEKGARDAAMGGHHACVQPHFNEYASRIGVCTRLMSLDLCNYEFCTSGNLIARDRPNYLGMAGRTNQLIYI